MDRRGRPSVSDVAALQRLELICDTYCRCQRPFRKLPPNCWLKVATSGNTDRRNASLETIDGCSINRPDRLHVVCSDAEGGWYACSTCRRFEPEEDLVVDLLTSSGVLVHPGYFFDFPRESYLIVSLLTPPEPFAEGVGRLLRHFDCSGPVRA